MNQIYNKNKPKRKYVRKPLCQNVNGICTFTKCRCDMAIKVPKGKLPPLDKTFKHRDKVVKIMRTKELQKLDSEMEIMVSPRIDYCGACKKEHGYDCPKDRIRGYHPEKKKNYGNILFRGFMILLISALLYPFVIAIMDLLN